MEAKLSSDSTISAASLAASVPLRPMAMPTSACLSDGASLTPSPVIATTAPPDCNARTTRSLCSGLARANTSAWAASTGKSASSTASRSRPSTTTGSSARPSCRAMAAAVAAWSPVIIFTATPALRQSATAAIASARGGSMKPTRPRNSSPAMSSCCRRPPARSTRRMAKPSTRSPREAAAAIAASQYGRSSGTASPPAPSCHDDNASSCSGAPLAYNSTVPPAPRCRVAM